MFTLNNILSVAQSAIRAHQIGVQVTSQNISNAQTEGYSRQRVVLKPGVPISTALGPAATGVQISGFERMRDPLLDVGYRRDASKAASYSMRRDLLREVENVFGEPSEIGIGANLDAFWSSWEDLANDPMSASARGMVLQRATQVVSAFHHADAQLEAVKQHTTDRLRVAVQELNGLGEQVARLNAEIVSSEAGGGKANDLRDARDRLLDQMSKLATTRVTELPNGSVSVTVENTLFVDGGDSKTLAAPDGSPAQVVVSLSGTALSVAEEGSTIGELLGVLNTDMNRSDPNGVWTKLDKLAADLVDQVNSLHTQGNGNAGTTFFFQPVAVPPDPAPQVTANSIALSAAVDGLPENIAAGYGTTASDNTLALDLAELRSNKAAVDLGGGNATSFGGFYRDMISGIALRVRSAEDSTTVYETLAAQTDLRRQSVSGVSIDEELIHLMQHQQAYVAATRVISAVDEMLRDLLGMIR